MLGVDSDPDGSPGGIDDAQTMVQECHGLEGLHLAHALAGRLHVVRNGPGDGVTNDHEQLDLARHVVHALRDFARDEVAGRLFHGQLTRSR